MAKAITGRITLNLVTGIVITVATVLITVSWMAHKHDEQAAAGTETMVDGGLRSMSNRLTQLANDYGWWEEAYDAYIRGDTEWIDANMGTGITDTNIADFMAIISPTGTIDHAWLIDDAPDTIDSIITPAAIDGIRAIADRLPVENLAGEGGHYVDTSSVPMMLSIQHVSPVSAAAEVKNTDLPIIVFGNYLAEQRLHDIGTGFLIDDLHFARQSGSEAVVEGPVVTDMSGKQLGYFDWTPPQPGNALLRSVLVPIGIALTLFCVVALVTALRARRMAIALSESEREAVSASRTDSMTGLMNRTGFTHLVESQAYEAACRTSELAIIYIDVNGFKAVNDSIGHHGGDDLVRTLARRIQKVAPKGAEVARIGGDEFALALIDRAAEEKVAETARAITKAIDEPFTIRGFEFHVTASIGYAISGEAGLTPSEIIRRADLAMYQAKNGAERDAVGYHRSMETGALEKKKIERDLRRAIENNELKVFYQPVLRGADLKVMGLEALVRWTSRDLGPVSPALFIPVAEETGLIHDIGRLVMNQACIDLHRWPGISMAINVSPVQLRDPNFAHDIRSIVEGHGHSPSRFELELTEGILVNNPTIAQRKLTMLKDFGFCLSLDDFGTGFSSIGYLRQFPFDILKIDRSFVRDIGLNATANALIQSLVSLGDALDLSVIAEGIENDEQLQLLRLIRCEYVQGFMFSKPVSADEIDVFLAAVEAAGTAPPPVAPQLKVAATA